MGLVIKLHGSNPTDAQLNITLYGVKTVDGSHTSVVDFKALKERYGYKERFVSGDMSVEILNRQGELLFRCLREDGRHATSFVIPMVP